MNDWYDFEGIFLEECSNRFICLVNISGVIEEVYVQCSCRLDNFVDLKGKRVYLKMILKPKRVKYILVAFKYKRSYALLAPKIANDLFYEFLNSKKSSYIGKRSNIMREKKINGYKSDFYIDDTKSIIEVKALLSFEDTPLFPTVYSERAIKQLDEIAKLLEAGYICRYGIVSINPYVTNICFDSESLLVKKLITLMAKGLYLEYFHIKYLKNKWVLIKRDIDLSTLNSLTLPSIANE